MKMTASELKYQYNNHVGGHFFDRSSMKFFGDTMGNYYVPAATVEIETWSGETHTCYELQRRKPVKGGLTESAYFDIATFDRVLPKN